MIRRFVRQVAVIARRDFLATVATPAFLLFLFAPLFMLLFASVGGTGARMVAESGDEARRVVAIAEGDWAGRLEDEDARLRAIFPAPFAPAVLDVRPPRADAEAQARAAFTESAVDVAAVLYGPPEAPRILHTPGGERGADYLAALAETAARGARTGLDPGDRLSRIERESVARPAASIGAQQSLGFAAVFVIFLLTLLLAGQTVSMLAEEKGNKVIEILAAAVPLEAVFLGKLVGLFGVALLFITFWGGIALLGMSAMAQGETAAAIEPAVGLVPFVLLGLVYFTMGYLLLGAVFLGVGAQASSVREIQMLSLPITFFQMGMFGLASAGAASPGTLLALVAELFPFSSPFAMAARGAGDPRLWPHFAAIAWQLMWVVLTIAVASRAFRKGVLKSGPSFVARMRRRLGSG